MRAFVLVTAAVAAAVLCTGCWSMGCNLHRYPPHRDERAIWGFRLAHDAEEPPAIGAPETAAADSTTNTAPDTLETATAETGGNTDEPAGINIDMVFVEGGTFTMGCTPKPGSKYDCTTSEEPHRVTVSDFFIGRHEVTQGLWVAVMGNNPSRFTGDDSLPVDLVDWNDAQEFIRKLNAMTGRKYRLPTEAEWEYAARGGNQSEGYMYSGSDSLGEMVWAWYAGRVSGTYPAGTKIANELGIHDMTGNVQEWVNDWYGKYYYRSSPATNPAGPQTGKYRVLRGGSWNSGWTAMPVFSRSFAAPDTLSPEKTIQMAYIARGNGLKKDFRIGRYEVTQKLWKSVMGNNPSQFTGDDDLPVENVKRDDVYIFIERLKEKTGKGYRLPTAAEWEYAARGGIWRKGYRFSGSDDVYEVAWYYGNSDGKTRPVGTRLPNELGIYDMSGNVSEMVKGTYLTYGGSWKYGSTYCRVSSGGQRMEYDRSSSCGFRLASNIKDDIKIDLVSIDGGIFTMGCTPEEGNVCNKDDLPAREVAVDDFFISRYEVTQELWKKVMGWNPSNRKGNNLPVETVTWNDVEKFISELNRNTGKKYRLPTEAEWEYAARGGNKSKGYKYSGGNVVDKVAWYGGTTTHRVGAKQANELGIHDMSGNVDEWTSDVYGDGGSGSSPKADPQCCPPDTFRVVCCGRSSGSSTSRVVRGGSSSSNEKYCRVSSRGSNYHVSGNSKLGFRLAHDQ